MLAAIRAVMRLGDQRVAAALVALPPEVGRELALAVVLQDSVERRGREALCGKRGDDGVGVEALLAQQLATGLILGGSFRVALLHLLAEHRVALAARATDAHVAASRPEIAVPVPVVTEALGPKLAVLVLDLDVGVHAPP